MNRCRPWSKGQTWRYNNWQQKSVLHQQPVQQKGDQHAEQTGVCLHGYLLITVFILEPGWYADSSTFLTSFACSAAPWCCPATACLHQPPRPCHHSSPPLLGKASCHPQLFPIPLRTEKPKMTCKKRLCLLPSSRWSASLVMNCLGVEPWAKSSVPSPGMFSNLSSVSRGALFYLHCKSSRGGREYRQEGQWALPTEGSICCCTGPFRAALVTHSRGSWSQQRDTNSKCGITMFPSKFGF